MSPLKRMVKRCMPASLVDVLVRGVGRTSDRIAAWFGATRIGCILYYGLFSRAFWREFRGVLAGRRRYWSDHGPGSHGRYRLRRNVHRIEKGLLMRPRRDVFALDYIGETVRAFSAAARHGWHEEGPRTELQWARDVLDVYFASVGSHPAIETARAEYESVRAEGSSGARIPARRAVEDPPVVSYEAFNSLARQRKSVRWFLPQPVPRHLLDQAMEAALQAPSACNRQAFMFRVFDDPERVQEVASIPMGTQGFYQNFPVIIVVVGRLRAYPHHRDRHLIYVDGALASMSLMLALETLGLSSCPINWPDIEDRERRMARALALEPDERPIMLMAVGYPDPEGLVAYSQKKVLDDARTFN